MTKARQTLINSQDCRYYHVMTRCVRRAFLCGFDKDQQQSFEHRRSWIQNRIQFLAEVFAIDIAAYAVMSNHYHLVLHINLEKQAAWSDEEVIQRWRELYSGPPLLHRQLKGEDLTQAENRQIKNDVDKWRDRLGNISWFMRNLNEHIAREANKEDEVTGRFWESRFKSQALLDEKALLSCMVYVDLNPIRAGMAQSLQNSQYTSVHERIECRGIQIDGTDGPIHLMPFNTTDKQQCIPFILEDYLELADWSGRAIRDDKRGHITGEAPALLRELKIREKDFLKTSRNFESQLKTMAGSIDNLKAACERLGQRWSHGMRFCREAYSP